MRIKKILAGLLVFALFFVALLTFFPERTDGMDATFNWWYYVRTALLAFAAAMFLLGLVFIFLHRKAIARGIPNMKRYFPLLMLMVKRDFFVRYRRSVFGVLWTMLNPLANMLILTIVFSTLFTNKIENYPAYVLSGSIIFSCFSEATSGGLGSIVGNAGLMKKVYLPKYIFPVTKTISAFVNFLFSFVALLLVMIFTGVGFHVQMVLAIELVLLLFVFCVGVSLVLATLYVFFRDIQYLYNIITTALLYMSAVFYDISIVPVKYMPLFAVNPVLQYIRFFREAVIYGQWPTLTQHMTCTAISLGALSIGLFVFYRKQNEFILYI